MKTLPAKPKPTPPAVVWINRHPNGHLGPRWFPDQESAKLWTTAEATQVKFVEAK